MQVTVLERLGDDKKILNNSYKYMGNKTKDLSDEIEKFLGISDIATESKSLEKLENNTDKHETFTKAKQEFEKIENKLYRIRFDEVKEIKKGYVLKEDIYVAELDVSDIHSWDDYISKIEKIFHFPTLGNNMNGYLDWMRDLSWLNKDGYVFFIYNFEKLVKNNAGLSEDIIEMFIIDTECILSWWEKYVEIYVVAGEKKPFNVYLVD